MTYPRLLAKSSNSPNAPQESETLAGHSQDVEQAAKAIIDTVGERALHAMALPEKLLPDLQTATRLASIAHDIGKAADSFQDAVRPPHNRQALRHEWISAWLLVADQGKALQSWLFSETSEAMRIVVIAAVLGHHRKARQNDFYPRPGGGRAMVVILCQHPDFFAFLKLNKSSGSAQNSLENIQLDILRRNPLEALTEWTNQKHTALSGDHDSLCSSRFVALVKAMLIAADVAGSAVIDRAEDWAKESLAKVCLENDMDTIVREALTDKSPRRFQDDLVALAEGQVGLATAGCGSGKTIGAYMWARRHATGRKVFFCYPTTGTATEGFRDYALNLPSKNDSMARLLHSRVAADLRHLRINGTGDREDDCDDRQGDMSGSLAAWGSGLVICTAHQVLGLMQNQLGGLCLLPAVVNSAVVFDEIHLFEDRMFAALLAFLDTFPNTPTLLMTASLQNWRRKQLCRHLAPRLREIGGAAEWEGAPRYRFRDLQDVIPWESVECALREGCKVLVVANTQKRAVEIWDEANERCDKLVDCVYCYHSRFKYYDRRKRHRDVVDAFKKDVAGPALAITTQVCEVSLDISSDLLVSELAPIPAMIQRLGRLNRVDNPHRTAEVYFVRPKNSVPYGSEDYGNWRESSEMWLTQLATMDSISQTDMATKFMELAQPPDGPPPPEMQWLAGGVFAFPGVLADFGSSVAVVMAEDEQSCYRTDGKVCYANLIDNEIPMFVDQNMTQQIRQWQRLAHAFIAPPGRIEYSPDTGASWSGQRHLIL